MTIDRSRAGARASILAGAVALALSFAAQAQDLTFDIGAGDLKAALEAYTKQTGQQLVYQPDDVKDRTTPGVHGAMTSEQALTALLAGTGLKVNKDPSGAIAIFPAEAVAGAASTKTAGNDQKLEEVIVTATAISQIYVTSRSATRLDTDPMKLPLSISAVQGDLMQQQQARTLTDVLNNVAGVDVSAADQVTTRGFIASVARNGTIQTGMDSMVTGQRPTVAVGRVEVVKGPQQIMQGSGGGIGGTVNLITKVPEAAASAYLGSAVGSDGYWRLDADLNDTLVGDEGNRLMGRLIGSSSGAGKTDVGYDGASNDFVSAGLRWDQADWGTDLAVVYEYNTNSNPAPGIVVSMGDSFHSGMRQYALGAKDAYLQMNSSTVDVNLTQKLWQTWTLGINYIWRDADNEVQATTPLEVLAPDTVFAISVGGRGRDSFNTSNDLKLDIRGEFNTGHVAHKLMFAYDYTSSDGGSPAAPISVANYFTNLTTREKTYTANQFPSSGFSYDVKETGLLLVDLMNWNAWSGMFGVRWVDTETTQGMPGLFSDTLRGDDTLPQYGIVYQATPEISLYASGGEGFVSNSTLRDWQDQPLPNETSTQYEAGVKALLLDRQIAVTLALYRIHQENVAKSDPDPNHYPPDGDWVYVSIPGLTSKGVEFEVSGQPIRGLQMRANYTYTQQEDDDGEPPLTGYVPSSFNLWAQYWLSRDVGRGWWGALGLTAKNSVEQQAGSFNIPGYTVLDMQAGYSTEQWSAIAGFKNVGDVQTYYPTWQSGPFAAAAPGASFTFDLNYRF